MPLELSTVEKLAAARLMERVRRLTETQHRVLTSLVIDRIVHAEGHGKILTVSVDDFEQALGVVESHTAHV